MKPIFELVIGSDEDPMIVVSVTEGNVVNWAFSVMLAVVIIAVIFGWS